MIRLMHSRVSVFVSAFLLIVGCALTAIATETITKSQAMAMIDARLAAAGVIVFGAFWVLLVSFTGRQEKTVTAALARIAATDDRMRRIELALCELNAKVGLLMTAHQLRDAYRENAEEKAGDE